MPHQLRVPWEVSVPIIAHHEVCPLRGPTVIGKFCVKEVTPYIQDSLRFL